MVFHDFAKCQKSIGPRPFWSIEKGWSKYLIEPVVYGDFLCHFRKMDLKSIKKALGFSLKVVCVLRLCKMSKKHWSYSILEHPKKLIMKSYKTCWILIIFGAQNAKWPPKWSKSIRFFTINHMAFRHVEKPYKTYRKWRLLGGQKLTMWAPAGRPGALLGEAGGAGITPPPFIWMAGWPEKSPKFLPRS